MALLVSPFSVLLWTASGRLAFSGCLAVAADSDGSLPLSCTVQFRCYLPRKVVVFTDHMNLLKLSEYCRHKTRLMTALLLYLVAATAAAAAAQPAATTNNNAVSCSALARFTFVSPRVVRLEHGPRVEDRSSVAFAHRGGAGTAPKLRVDNDTAVWCNVTVLAHPGLTLSFRKDGDRGLAHDLTPAPPPFDYFRAHDLTITLPALGVTWHASQGVADPTHNLGGTLHPTPSADLAHCCSNPSNTTFDPKYPLQPGVLSRAGWALLGNDDGPLIENGTGDFDDGWIANRSADWTGYDYHFFGCGREYAACLDEFTAVSGRMAVPTHRGLGVWWSRHWGDPFDGIRFGPMTHDAIMHEVVDGYASRGLPLDIVVTDMEWHSQVAFPDCDTFLGVKGWSGYNWNKTLFPDPDAFLAELHARNISLALNFHPDASIDACQTDYYEGMAKALGVATTNTRKPPLPDIDLAQFNQTYVDAYFTWAMETSARADVAWTDTAKATTWSNYLYSRYPAKKNKRVINFSRYGGVGDQRTPIGFSGDTLRKWDTLAYEVWMTPRAANIGFGWWSHDIGGFSGGYLPGSNHTESAELFLRWLQFAAYAPIFRTHCRYCDQRIWTFGEKWYPMMKDTMLERHRLFPYINTHAHLEAYRKGRSLLVPMYWDTPSGHDDVVYAPGAAAQQQYKFGLDFVVAPVVASISSSRSSNGETVAKQAWLPPGRWAAWNTVEGRSCAGSDSVVDGPAHLDLACALGQTPVFVNASAMVPTRSTDVKQGSGLPISDPLVWVMFPAAAGTAAEGQVFEDDGVTMDYHRQMPAHHAATAGLLTRAAATFNATHACVRVQGGEGTFTGLPATRTQRFEMRGVTPGRVTIVSGAGCRVLTMAEAGGADATTAVVDCGPRDVHESVEMCVTL